MPSVQMVFDLIARDAASPAFRRAATSADAAAVATARAGAALDKFGKFSAVAAAGFVAYGAKQASEFNRLTTVYVTAAGESQKNLALVQKGVLAVARETGTAWQHVAEAAYTAEKAGYRGADVYKITKAAAQGAKEENAELGTVTNAVTSIMASYHLKAEDAVSVTNQLKAAAGESKTSFELFSGSLSTVLPLASAAGVSFADVAGVLATLTQHGTTADQATQEIANAIRNLHAPNMVAQREMAQLGISANDVSTKLGDGPGGRGLSGTLNYLSKTVLEKMGPSGTLLLDTFNQSQVAAADATRIMNALPPAAKRVAEAYDTGAISLGDYRKEIKGLPTDQAALVRQFVTTRDGAKGFQQALKNGVNGSQTYTEAIKKMTGGANGLNVVLQATGESAEGTAHRIKFIQDAAKNAGKDVSGWALTLGLSSTQADRFKQTMQALAIETGQKVLPALTKVAGFLADHPIVIKGAIGAIAAFGAAWTAVKIGNLISSLAAMARAIRAVGLASALAGTQTRAAGLATAAGAAGTAGAGGAGAVGAAGVATRAGRFNPLKLVIPVAVGYVALKALGLDDTVKPLIQGDVAQVYAKSPGWVKDVANRFQGGAIGAAPTAGGDFRKLNTQFNATSAKKDYDDAQAQLGILNSIGRGKSPLAQQLAAQLPGLKAQYEAAGDALAVSQVQAYYKALNNKKVIDASKAALKDKTSGDDPDDVANKLFSKKKDGGLSGSFSPEALKQLDDLKLKMAGTSTSVAELTTRYGLSARAARDLADSNYDYNQVLSNVRTSLSSTTHTLEGNSAEALSNRRAISGAVLAVEQHSKAVLSQTGSAAAANAVFRSGIADISANAAATGINKAEVDKYIGSINAVPPAKNTTLNLDSAAALGAAAAFESTLANIPRYVPVVIDMIVRSANVGAAIAGAVSSAKADVFAAGAGAIGNATGGYIRGPGTGTSDSIPAWLSNGEYVINAAATRRFLPLLQRINAQKFASGGQVGKEPLIPGTLVTATQAMKDALRKLAKEAEAIAKIGVTGVLKTTTGDIKAGQKAIADAVKQGNGPLQKQLAGQLRAASGNLYATGLRAVQDKVITPAEALTIKAAANTVERLTKQLTKLNTVNQIMLDKLKSFVQTQTQFRDSLQSTLSSGNTFSDVLSHSGTGGDVVTLLKDKLTGIRKYGASIRRLKAAGYSDAIVREISSDGIAPAIQYADLLLGLPKSQQTEIKGLAGDLSAGQLSTANYITKLTQGSTGLTNKSAIDALNKAIYSPGANQDYWSKQAEYRERTGVGTTPKAVTVMHVEKQYNAGIWDLRQEMERARFVAETAGVL